MKNVLLFIFVLVFGSSLVGQITANGNSGQTTTAYTNGTPNNPIYIWCSSGLATQAGSLTATPPAGVGPFTFNWFYHNSTTFSWEPYASSVGATSTLTNLPSDQYRVQIYNGLGVLVACHVALVWNMNGDVTTSNTPTACNGTNLTGTVAANNFVYYNPPPPESIITATTQVQVCFSATHTYVSDLAFYLIGPASCGSPVILLSPNPPAPNTICNSGNNINNFCFSTTSAANFNVCTAATPLTGTFGSYGVAPALPTPINWSPLIGCNAAEAGWTVQIFDCIAIDVGFLTNATITFSNLPSLCGSPTSITYNSGVISSPINDMSCSAATASIFQVPATPQITTPITINPTVSYLWTAAPAFVIPGASSSLTPSVSGLPNGTTNFSLTATVSHGATSCNYSSNTSYTVDIPAVPTTSSVTHPTCAVPSGTIVFTAQSGVEYSVNNGSSYQAGTTFSGLVPGSYILRVRSTTNSLCSTQGATITINPIPLPPSVPTATATQPTCAVPSGTITFTAQAGVEYSVNNGTSYQAGTTFSGLVPGSYTIRVRSITDNTCSTQGAATITINPVPTAPAVPTVTTTQPTCAVPTGTITFSAQADVEYSINNGTSYQSGTTFSGLAPGSYVLRVRSTTDNTCSTQGVTAITINVVPSAPAVPTATITQPTCPAPSGTITFTSPLSGVEYSINNGTSYQSGTTFSGLAPGSYILRVRNIADNTCTTQGATVSINTAPSAPASPTATVTQPTCAVPTGQIVFNFQNNIEYSINNGTTYQAGTTFSGLTPGDYILRIRRTNGTLCSTQGATVTINPVPSAPTVPTATAVQPTCAVPTGTITFTAQAGVEYSINNGTSYQAGITFSGLAPGSYTLRVRSTTDNTCSTQGAAAIIINAVPTAPTAPTATAVQPTCAVPTGTITFTAQAGVEYSINNGTSYQAGITFSGLTPGSYTLRVRNLADNTCSTQGAAAITINAVPTAPSVPTASATQPTCAVPTGTITFTTQAGVEYSIDNGTSYQAGTSFSGLAPGSYILRVRSIADNTCSTQGITISIDATPSAPTAPTATVVQPICGAPTGTITFTAQAGVEYSIDNGTSYQVGTTFSGLAPGSYTLRVRSIADNTCSTVGATLNLNLVICAVDDIAGPISAGSGGTDVINVLDNDSLDGATATTSTVTITSIPSGPLTVNSNGSVDVAPSAPAGTYTVSYVICEILNPSNCDTAIVTVFIVPDTDTTSIVLDEDTSFTLCTDTLTSFLDPIVSVTICGNPINGQLDSIPGTTCFNYQPELNYYGQDEFCLVTCTAAGLCDTTIVLVTVNPINDNIIANSDSLTINATDPVIVSALSNDTDVDGIPDISSVVILSNPQFGNVIINPDGTITYTPDSLVACESDSFVYQVCDTGFPNPATCDSATVFLTIIDNVSPVISNCSTDINVFADIDECGAIVLWDEPTYFDNCQYSVSISSSPLLTLVNGSMFPVGSTTMTYVITDSTGLTDTCSFVITVTDNQNPVILNGPSDTTVYTTVTSCQIPVSWIEPTITDNCGIQTIDVSHNQNDVFSVGVTTVTYDVIDVNGNTNTYSFNVTVIDTIAPTMLDCQEDIIVSNDPGICGAIITWQTPRAIDNCGGTLGFVLTSDYVSGEVFPVGLHSVEYVFADSSGNEVTCEFTVTVNDSEDPIISQLSSDIFACSNAPTLWEEPTITDNCEVDTVIMSSSPTVGLLNGDTFPIGTTTITYTVNDIHGNVTTGSFDVVVNNLPVVELTNTEDLNLCLGESNSLQVQSPTFDLTYTWELNEFVVGSGSSYAFQNATSEDAGLYTVTATDNAGCVTEASTQVIVGACGVVIPEAFTPNGNGQNEMFYIQNLDAYPNTEVVVFNRWGSKVFETKNYQNDWAGISQNNLNIGGEKLPEGTYFYIIKLGGDEQDEAFGKIYKGYVYIKR